MPTVSTKPRVILQCNYGSHPEVVRVYAFDQSVGVALVKMRFHDGEEFISRMDLHELQAIHDDPQGTFADVRTALVLRAEELLHDEK
ncbi:hypothetical protein [Gemmata sp.]|uniref:hypothetical protein n=1 Tax=Gemmata sp. TaxID=1914242 RepID=UPI003F717E56